MEQAKAIILIVVAAVIVIELFLVFGEQLPVIYQQVNHMVTASARDRLTQTLVSDERRIGIAPPDTNIWNVGESGLYLLGIRNRYSETKEFYVNVYLEELEGDLAGRDVGDYQSEVDSWLSYAKNGNVGPQDYIIINIVVMTGEDAEPGIYAMRAVVCEDENCSTLSDSNVYSSMMFTFVII